MNAMIYIVIPVYNRINYTRTCLTCLQAQTVREHRVIVVDDGSSDGTAEMIQAEFPHVVVCTGTGSLWWAGGTNLGIRCVLEHMDIQENDFILTLNDDTEIAPDYLANLLNAFYEQPHPCLIGSISVDIRNPNRLIYAGTQLNMMSAKLQDLAKTRFGQQYDQLVTGPRYFPSDCLPGRGMFIPKAVFTKIGLFDEAHFQHHMADLDFSIRARKAGFPLLIATTCIIQEHTEATGFIFDKSVSLSQFWNALFTTRSPLNLKTRYHFARIHASVMPIYLAADLARIFGGYIVRRLRRN